MSPRVRDPSDGHARSLTSENWSRIEAFEHNVNSLCYEGKNSGISSHFGRGRHPSGFIFVVGILDLIMTGAIPKWAIFAPIFVPQLMRLGVAPEAVLATYRVGDSPMNSISPMNAYFAPFAAKYT